MVHLEAGRLSKLCCFASLSLLSSLSLFFAASPPSPVASTLRPAPPIRVSQLETLVSQPSRDEKNKASDEAKQTLKPATSLSTPLATPTAAAAATTPAGARTHSPSESQYQRNGAHSRRTTPHTPLCARVGVAPRSQLPIDRRRCGRGGQVDSGSTGDELAGGGGVSGRGGAVSTGGGSQG